MVYHFLTRSRGENCTLNPSLFRKKKSQPGSSCYPIFHFIFMSDCKNYLTLRSRNYQYLMIETQIPEKCSFNFLAILFSKRCKSIVSVFKTFISEFFENIGSFARIGIHSPIKHFDKLISEAQLKFNKNIFKLRV